MKRITTRMIAAGAALAAAVSLGACGSSNASDDESSESGKYAVNSDTLVFGAVPDSAATETNYQPLMDYIAEKTGKKVTYQQSTDYAALIEASVAGKIDVASFSGFTYVTA